MNRLGVASDSQGIMARHSRHILDELLVLAAQDGNAQAFASLLRRFGPRLRQHAWRLSGDESAADDIAQEAWLAIVRGLRRLDDPARFRAWALRIVTHKATDWIRRRTRERTLRKSVETREPTPTERDSIHETASAQAEQTSRLRVAISQLSPELRAVIGLHYGEDLSVAEIAHVLDIPPGTVKSRLHNARAQLKPLIERNEP